MNPIKRILGDRWSRNMTKVFGMVNDETVEYGSVKEMKEKTKNLPDNSNVLLFVGKAKNTESTVINNLKDAQNFVQFKKDKYGYPANKDLLHRNPNAVKDEKGNYVLKRKKED